MMVARRTFLIGIAALVASPALNNKFVGETAIGRLPSPLKWRSMFDFTMSSMPTGEEIRSPAFREDPVNWTIFRGDDAVYTVTMNPRATVRWVCMPDHPIVVPEGVLIRAVVEPCHTETTLHITSDIERDRHPLVRRRTFAECYRWRDGKPILESCKPLDPRDADVLAA